MANATDILVWLVLLTHIVIALYLFEGLAIKTNVRTRRFKLWSYIGNNALVLGFVISLVAMLGSLYFSEIMGYAPCTLCWYQRIFIYAQVFLFGTALWKHEHVRIWTYSLVLSVVGALIAAFQYYIQFASKPIVSLPCSALGSSASCTEKFITYFGYITIPMMSLTIFVTIIILGAMARKNILMHHSIHANVI